MKLVKKEHNFYLDEETETYYEFVLFTYSVEQKEAERRAYAYFRKFQDGIGLGDYYKRTHLIFQTGYVDPQR